MKLCRLAYRAAQRRKLLLICKVLAPLARKVMLARQARLGQMAIQARLAQLV